MEENTMQNLQMKMTFGFIMVSLLIAPINAIAALHRDAWPKTLQALIHTDFMVPREEDHCGELRNGLLHAECTARHLRQLRARGLCGRHLPLLLQHQAAAHMKGSRSTKTLPHPNELSLNTSFHFSLSFFVRLRSLYVIRLLALNSTPSFFLRLLFSTKEHDGKRE
jgi:hypothetical protein